MKTIVYRSFKLRLLILCRPLKTGLNDGLKSTVLVTRTYTAQQNQMQTSIFETMIPAFDRIIYPSTIQPVQICTLKNSINGYMGDKTFCFAIIGKAVMKDAEQMCTDLNARLPLPKDPEENKDFIRVIDRLGLSDFIDIEDEKIILDLNYTADPNPEQQVNLSPTKTRIQTGGIFVRLNYNSFRSNKICLSSHFLLCE